jgi:hypothetical protein
MAEPASTALAAGASVTGALVIVLGPVIGPWVAVLLTSLIGSLWTIGRVETASRLLAAALLSRIILTSLVLTGLVSFGLESVASKYAGISLPADYVLPGVAFAISALGDKINVLRELATKRLSALIGGGTAQ